MHFKNIAMIVRQFSPHGGLELYTYKLVEELLARGLKVTVICQQSDASFNSENLTIVKYPGVRSGQSKWQRMQEEFLLASQATKSAGSFDLIHSQHCPTDYADVVTFHNHSTQRLNEVGLWWEKLLNSSKRTFATAYKLRDKYDDLLCRNASCLIFPSQIMQADYYHSYPSLIADSAKPYVVAMPGADLAQDPVEISKPNRSAQELGFNFLFVGRGFRKKGLDILLAACKILHQEKRPFKLLIAGLPQKRIDYLRLKSMGLENIVDYLGFQKDMDAVYAKASALVLPSRVEPFGMAPLQGMRHGLVPIVSRVSGVTEMLHDGQDSLILDNHLDASELAALMRKLMTDNKLTIKLSEQARKNADCISWHNTAEQTLRAYEIAWSKKANLKN